MTTRKTNTQLARALSDILMGYQTIAGRVPVCRFEVGGIHWLNMRDAITRLQGIGDHVADASNMVQRGVDVAAVMAWARDPGRKSAQMAFTAGPERQAAYWMEIAWDAGRDAGRDAGCDAGCDGRPAMSVTPRITLVAWADRLGRFVFVADPSQRGRYIRTDRSVVMAPCSHCGSIKGEPCKGRQGYGGSTHVARRVAAGRISNRGLHDVDDVTVPEPVETTPQEWMEAAA